MKQNLFISITITVVIIIQLNCFCSSQSNDETIVPVLVTISTPSPPTTTNNDESMVEIERPDNENDDQDDDEYDLSEVDSEDHEATTKNAQDEDQDDDEDEEEEDDEEEYEQPACNVKTMLENVNLTAFLPEDNDVLKKELESTIEVNDDGGNNGDPLRLSVSPSMNHTIQRLDRLVGWARQVADQQQIRAGITNFIHQNFDIFLNLDLDSQCVNSIVSILMATRKNEPWSFKFIDSSPKIPSGLMQGVASFLGNFDECIQIESPGTADKLYGRYCTVKPLLPLPADIDSIDEDNDDQQEEIIHRIMSRFLSSYNVEHYFRTNRLHKFIELIKSRKGRTSNIGICVPHHCDGKQLQLALNKLLYPIIGLPLEVQESACWTKSKMQQHWSNMDPYAKSSLIIIAALFLWVSIATAFDLYRSSVKPNSDLPIALDKIIDIWSAKANTGRLIQRSTNRIQAMDSLRLLMIIMIGLCNAFYLTPLTSLLHNVSISVPGELMTSSKYLLIRAPILFNDGLTIIAAALFIRSVFKALNNRNHPSTFVLYLVKRWFRLTVPLLGSILFLFTLPSFGNGPLWSRIEEILLPPCRSWPSIISSMAQLSNWNVIRSNYTNDDHYVVCNPDSWFISIIFQLNLAFLPIAFLMYQSPKNGLRILIVILITSLLLNISPRLFMDNGETYYEMSSLPSLWHVRRSFYLYHQNLLQYIGSFAIGLFLGYAIVVNDYFQQKNDSLKIIKSRIIVCNILAVIGLILPFIWVDQFFGRQAPNRMLVLSFFSIGRIMFSMALAWIIYAAATDNSPFFRQLFSISSIQSIAKLSYSIFLVQTMVQYQRLYSMRETFAMTIRTTIEHYICDFCISIVIGYLLHLLFEAPAIRLISVIGHLKIMNRNIKCHDINQNNNDDDQPSKQQVDNDNSSSWKAIDSISDNFENVNRNKVNKVADSPIDTDAVISIHF